MDFCGGTAHKVDNGIYHLIRGEIYTIDKKIFFVFGGASSHDKDCRTKGKNWWEAEMPNEQEYDNEKNNLEKNNFKVDYVITHSAPTSVQNNIAPTYEINKLTEFFESIKNKLTCQKWFFGHYHKDIELDDKFKGMFNKIIRI